MIFCPSTPSHHSIGFRRRTIMAFPVVSLYELKLPADMESSLRLYLALDEDLQRRFDRACRWFQYAQAIWHISPSAALISFVISLESLRFKANSQRCDRCRQIIQVTQGFKSLVEALVPGSEQLKQKFYRTRSNLVHGNWLLQSELRGWDSQSQLRDDSELLQLAGVTRVALHNWLIPHLREKANP